MNRIALAFLGLFVLFPASRADGIDRDRLDRIDSAVETAIRQAQNVNSEGFGRKLRKAQVGAGAYPVPEQERMPWFFVRRPSQASEHEVNERFAAAIRQVIEGLDRERAEDDEGALTLLAFALNHARTEVGS